MTLSLKKQLMKSSHQSNKMKLLKHRILPKMQLMLLLKDSLKDTWVMIPKRRRFKLKKKLRRNQQISSSVKRIRMLLRNGLTQLSSNLPISKKIFKSNYSHLPLKKLNKEETFKWKMSLLKMSQ